MLGSHYVGPPVRRQVLDIPSGHATLTVDGGNITTTPAVKQLAIDIRNKVIGPGGKTFSMKIVPATGAFSGAFRDTNDKPHAFRGVLLQQQNFGTGIFGGDGQTGRVDLQVSP